MRLAFCRRPRCGCLARHRCRQSGGRAVDGQRRGCVAMPDTSRFRSKSLRLASPSAPGAGSNGARVQPSRSPRAFARLRIRVAHRDDQRADPRPQEWLLIEWPKGEAEPTKYWLSTLPNDIAFDRLVDLAKLRWRIERDYQELKQEVGLGQFEGRGWRGFHHYATLCIAAYGFLISERETIPPCGPRAARFIPAAELSDGYRPRGSAAAD